MSAVFICIVPHIVILEQFYSYGHMEGMYEFIHVNIKDRWSSYRQSLIFCPIYKVHVK